MYVYTHTRTCIYSRDRESEQDKKIKNYVLNKLESKFNDASKGGYSDYISVYYFMTALILDIFLKILQMDGTLAVLSVAFVFSYIWVATGWHSRKSALQSCDTSKERVHKMYKNTHAHTLSLSHTHTHKKKKKHEIF